MSCATNSLGQTLDFVESGVRAPDPERCSKPSVSTLPTSSRRRQCAETMPLRLQQGSRPVSRVDCVSVQCELELAQRCTHAVWPSCRSCLATYCCVNLCDALRPLRKGYGTASAFRRTFSCSATIARRCASSTRLLQLVAGWHQEVMQRSPCIDCSQDAPAQCCPAWLVGC